MRNNSNHKKNTIVSQAGFDQIVAARGGKDSAIGQHSGQNTLRMSHVLQSNTASQSNSRAQSGQKRQTLKVINN